jgi:RimJ/RimL family protein N-acetyltransferase
MRPAKPQLRPTLRTARLLLRPIVAADLDDVVAGIGDFAVSRMLARVPHPYTRADADWFFDHSNAAIDAGTMLYLGIEHGGRIVGAASIEAIPASCELGYWLARPAWGNGFMTEAVGALVGYAFDSVGIPMIRSGYFSENEGSRRVQDKLGFTQIGVSTMQSLARGSEVAHIDTVLTPARFRETAR